MGKRKLKKVTSEIEIDGREFVVKNTETGVMKRRTDITPRYLTKIQREESAQKLREAKNVAKEVAKHEKERARGPEQFSSGRGERRGVGIGRFWQELNASFPWLKFALAVLLVVLPWHEAAMMREARDVEVAQYGVLGLAVPPAPTRDLTGKKLVALTFDDGPSSSTTGRLLDILRDKQVKATFFVVGTMAQQAPELVKREEAEGHEVASHTLAHHNLARMSSDAIKSETTVYNEIMQKILGKVPAITRPPYGAMSGAVRTGANQPLILWSVDPEDWKDRKAEIVRERVKTATYDGAIVLMHDIHASTVDAVAGIIDDLRGEGYEFLTVSELAEVRGVDLENGVTYGSFRP